MAGKALQKIYCWQLISEQLSVFLASTDKGGHRIWLSLKKYKNPIDFFRERLKGAEPVMEERANLRLIDAVSARLENRPLKSMPPLDASFTPFEKKVYEAISQIPFGETRQYGEVASFVERPGGARAVGRAMGRNPFPIIFP